METPKNLLGNTPSKPPLKTFNSGNSTTANSLSPTVKLVIIFAVGLLLGGLAIWLVVAAKNDSSETALIPDNNTNTGIIDDTDVVTPSTSPLPTPTTPLTPVAVSGSNAIEANDQPAGNTVEVNMITLSVTGWVAIHEERDGGLGNVLGAGRFEPGIYLGDISLLRNTVAGGTYYAVLYQDDGDKVFDKATDAPIKNADGQIIQSVFKTN